MLHEQPMVHLSCSARCAAVSSVYHTNALVYGLSMCDSQRHAYQHLTCGMCMQEDATEHIAAVLDRIKPEYLVCAALSIHTAVRQVCCDLNLNTLAEKLASTAVWLRGGGT